MPLSYFCPISTSSPSPSKFPSRSPPRKDPAKKPTRRKLPSVSELSQDQPLHITAMEKVDLYRLPNELICCIIQAAGENGDCRLLRNLCLASRLLQPLAQVTLYRNLKVPTMKAYGLLTRSLIENPSLRGFIRTVDISISGSRYMENYCTAFKSWGDYHFDDSKLNESDRNLLVLCKTVCYNKSASENARCVLSLFLLMLDRVEDLKLDLNYFSRPAARILAAGLEMSLTTSKVDSGKEVSRRALFPSLKRLTITGDSIAAQEEIIFGAVFHPIAPLLSSTNLVDLVVVGDRNAWPVLDVMGLDQYLPLRSLQLDASKTDVGGLCKMLRRCPDLRRLRGSFRCPHVVYPFNERECINKVLPSSCPHLEELSFSIQGCPRFFTIQRFGTVQYPLLTCLPQMTNLKELRIDIDCFFGTPRKVETMGSKLPEMLPPRLEKLFLDATWVLNGIVGRISAKHPEVMAYKRGIESIVTSLCAATKTQLMDLKIIVIGSKYGKHALWTKQARKQLAGTDVKIKLFSAQYTGRLWNCPWEQIISI